MLYGHTMMSVNKLQAEKEKVETAVRNYLAEKPAEDAIREKELQKSRAETEEVQNELADTQTQRDALQVPPYLCLSRSFSL